MKVFLILLFIIPRPIFSLEFNKDVKPILSRNCFPCHGKDKQKGKLRLDLRESAVLRKALIPGDHKKSLIIEKVLSKDPDEIMPPPEKEPLSKEQIEILKEWIGNGAQYESHWSFTQVKEVSVPQTKDTQLKSPIDKFIGQKLSVVSLKPESEAPKEILIRRLSLVLTGLPPEKDLREKFISGKITYENAVDALLASSAYGENMALFWLDGARYADTNGIEYDNSRPIWPYRDWVVNAFNNDMPYDQFIIEQLAGDLLPNPKVSQLIATGFNRSNLSTNEQGSLEEEFQVRYAKDRLNTTASVFMGLTVNCAECHDHKYDPVTQKEYYQMLSYFNNIEGLAVGYPFDRSDPPLIPVISDSENEKLNQMQTEIKTLKNKMAVIKNDADSDFFFWHYSQLTNPPKAPFIIGKLEGYFALNEDNGNTTLNLINEQMCNIKGILSRTLGKHKYGLKFRASSFVDCLDICDYEKNNSFSVGAWVKPEKKAEGVIIGKYSSELQKGWKLNCNSKQIIFELRNGPESALSIQTEDILTINKWNHVAAVYDGSNKAQNVKIFVNSKEVPFNVISDNLEGSIKISNNTRIGSDSHTGIIKFASLDEVFAGPVVLNKEQVQIISDFADSSRFSLVKPDNLTSGAKNQLYDYYLKNFNEKYSPLYHRLRELEVKIEDLFNSSTTSMVMQEKPEITPTYILKRGNYETKGEKVERKTPAFLPDFDINAPNNRLGFAQWLVSKNHPLTSRVAANRLWNEIFGRGLVESLDDFGIQGSYPSHSELLDYLANDLMQNKWSIKSFIKMLVLSHTFKQHSRVNSMSISKDPENHLYSRYPRRRLKAEQIRDQSLAVSGKLNRTVGGKPVKPYQPRNLWESVTADISNTYRFSQSKGTDNYRRSLYTFWKRNCPPPSMIILNSPTRQFCTVSRNISNTPLQALVLLNDPQFVELHKFTGEKMAKLNLSKNEKITYLYELIFSHSPSPGNLKDCINFLNSTSDNWYALVQVLMNTDEFLTIE